MLPMKICIALLRAKDPLLIPTGDVNSVDYLAIELSKFLNVSIIYPNTALKRDYKIFNYSNKGWSDIFPFLSIYQYIKKIRKLSKNFDIVQLNLPSPSFAWIKFFLKKDTKYIMHFGSALFEKRLFKHFFKSPKHYLPRLINLPIFVSITKSLFDTCIVSSQFQKIQLVKLGISSQKIKVISNSVRDISKINKLKARKSFNLKKQDKIFLYVGHLLHVKGISYLFKAFDKMSKSDANLKLVIASSGRMACKKILKKYKSHIDKNKVIFFGKVNVEKLISASDILVLPYISNTGKHLFPSIMLEAFKINIPIITTNLETNKELIIHKKTGILVKPSNVNSLSKAMHYLINNKKLMDYFVKNQKKFQNKFKVTKECMEYLKVYRNE